MEQDNFFSGLTDVGKAMSVLNQFMRDNSSESQATEDLIDDLLKALFEDEQQLFGDADDFHNFAVTVAKIKNDNEVATRIIKKGLDVHETNTDLLADVIKYGYNCGEKELCFQSYLKLQSIPKERWTWRAFMFTIEYLMDIVDEKSAVLDSENISKEGILAIAKEYQKMLPSDEGAWLSECRIYERFNQKKEGMDVLKAAIDKFDFCPKCWMHYADIMLEEGNYEEAEKILKKMRRNPKTVEDVNTSYMYFLDGQCKMKKLVDSDDYDDGIIDEKEVMRVYRTFRLSLNSEGARVGIRTQIYEYIKRLELETDVKYPEEWKSEDDNM